MVVCRFHSAVSVNRIWRRPHVNCPTTVCLWPVRSACLAFGQHMVRAFRFAIETSGGVVGPPRQRCGKGSRPRDPPYRLPSSGFVQSAPTGGELSIGRCNATRHGAGVGRSARAAGARSWISSQCDEPSPWCQPVESGRSRLNPRGATTGRRPDDCNAHSQRQHYARRDRSCLRIACRSNARRTAVLAAIHLYGRPRDIWGRLARAAACRRSIRFRESTEAGGLIADVDQIANSIARPASSRPHLGGAKPNDLPVHAADLRVELVINLKTAKALCFRSRQRLLHARSTGVDNIAFCCTALLRDWH